MNPLSKNKYLLVMTDAYSKWMEITALPNKTTVKAASAIYKTWIAAHGCPKTLLSDQGKEFDSNVMKELCSMLKIKHAFSSTGHPRSNGLVENRNRTILSYCRKYLAGSNDWESLLPSLKMAYNTASHSSTGYTPFFLTYGRHPTLPSSLITNDFQEGFIDDELGRQMSEIVRSTRRMRSLLHDAHSSQKEQFDKRARKKDFKVGDRMYVTRPHSGPQAQKLQPLYRGPYVVRERRKHNNYLLEEEATSKFVLLHADRLKPVPFVHQQWKQPLNSDEPGPVMRRILHPNLSKYGRGSANPPWSAGT